MVLIRKNLINVSSQGTMAISKLTSKLNQKLLSMEAGHKQYFANLKHAAYGES